MNIMRSLLWLPLAMASAAFAQTAFMESSSAAVPASSSAALESVPAQEPVAISSSPSVAIASSSSARAAEPSVFAEERSSSSAVEMYEVHSYTLLAPLPQMQVDSLRYGPAQRMRFGVHLGLGSVDFISDDDDVDNLDGLTWTAGLVGVFPLSRHVFSLQAEADVTARLVDHSYRLYSGTTEVARKDKIQQYDVSVPLLFTCRPLRSRVFFLFGPQVDFGFYDHLKIYKDGRRIANEDLVDDDARANMDWGLVMGLGVAATQHLQFDFRFGAGISDMYDNLYVDDQYWSFTAASVQMGITLLY